MPDTAMTRRRFLQTSTSAAALWIPASVNSYTHQEIQDLYVDGSMQANVSKWELDTPSLCVDLDALEANIATMQDTLTRNDIASRPHGKTHKSPTIARMQLDAGAIGICAAKVSEAEAMFQHGIDAVLMTTTNVTATKIRRAMNLRHANPQFIQATDSEQNARLLSEAAVSMGITADVVVDVDPGGHRTGITPGQPALALGQLIDQLPGLTLRGLLCYDGGSQHVKGFAARREQTLERLLGATDTFDLFNSSGLNTEIFSGGGTGSLGGERTAGGGRGEREGRVSLFR